MDCEPYLGELVASKGAEEWKQPKYILGMIVQINDWEDEEKYRIQWFDDYSICDYSEGDCLLYRERMKKLRKEYGL